MYICNTCNRASTVVFLIDVHRLYDCTRQFIPYVHDLTRCTYVPFWLKLASTNFQGSSKTAALELGQYVAPAEQQVEKIEHTANGGGHRGYRLGTSIQSPCAPRIFSEFTPAILTSQSPPHPI